jgi:CheY-like chemotaxis protein
VTRSTREPSSVWNLVLNAIKFTPKGGRVDVTLSREGSSAQIQVSDNGEGISAEVLPHVFDRFRQADSGTRRKVPGLGLGLSIVKFIVEAHGGTVEARSAGAGEGSTFTVRLPPPSVPIPEGREEEHGWAREAAGGERAAAIDAGSPSVRLDGLRVLVVDDDPDSRQILLRVLERAGAVVVAASSVREAIGALPAVRPEVLVSDLGMPDQDGFDLIRQVRALGYDANKLPAVALTAFAQSNHSDAALQAGFQMHVPKPADPHVLIAIIARVTGRGR